MALGRDDRSAIAREIEKVSPVALSLGVDTAEELAEALRSGPWDLVLAGDSPGLGWRSALDALEEGGLDIPLLVLAASAGAEEAGRAIRAGARDWLSRGDLPRLGAAAEREVRAARARSRLAVLEEERAHRDLVAQQLDLVRRFGNDILLLMTRDGSIVQANDRALAAYGYSEAEILTLNIRDLRAPETVGDVSLRMEAIISARGDRFATRHQRRDGSTFPVEVSSRPVELGSTMLVQSIMRDLTKDHADRAASEYQAMILENLNDAVIGLDTEMVVTAWNAAAHRMFGWSAADAIGRSLADVVPTEFANGTSMFDVRGLAEADEGGIVKLEGRRRARSGNWIEVEVTAVTLRGENGATLGFVSVNRDVSVRKRVEAALRASQERLQRILETSNEAIWVVDAEGRAEFANARAAEIFGFSETEIIGRSFVEALPEANRKEAQRDLEAVRRGQGGRREMELRRADGTVLRLAMSRSTLRAENGSVAGAVLVFMDVTETHRALEQLLQAQKMEAVGRLASGIAHDFNNLLVVVLGNSAELLQTLAEGDARREEAEGIRQAGERATRLVRQLLTFARKSPHRSVPVELDSVVQGIEKLLHRAVGEDVEMSVALRPQPWPVLIDPGQLEQVLMNLALNARDAMPQGGKLTIETDPVIVEPGGGGPDGLAPGPYSALAVSDTGCGMPPELLARIFEPFFTTKPVGKGTGLGLSMVHGIVELAGGKIAVASQPGQGTRFTVYLPASQRVAEETAPAEPSALRARGRSRTVLVAEDEDAVREVTRRMLERNGFSVVLARNGIEALKRLGEHRRFDLVLSDAVMPEGSGRVVAATLERDHPGVPLVLMTGYADREDLPQSAVGLVLKPFTEEGLLRAIHSALERSAA